MASEREERIETLARRWVQRAKRKGISEAEQLGQQIVQKARATSERVRSHSKDSEGKIAAGLSELGGMISELIARIGGAEDPKDSASLGGPPNLGNVAPHGSQPTPRRMLESEHVIPRVMISRFLQALGFAPVRRPSDEDDRLHTVMIYATAAHKKTHGAAGTDLRLINDLKKLASTGQIDIRGSSTRAKQIRRRLRDEYGRKGAREAVARIAASRQEKASRVQESLLDKMPAIMSARVEKTVSAVKKDQEQRRHERSHKKPLPDESQIRSATRLEVEDVVEIILERMKKSGRTD